MVATVFLVDDNLVFLKAVRSFINEVPDVRVIGQATCGTDALTRIAQSHPDLVFLDIGLPDLDGMDVAKTLSVWQQPPQIIFLTMSESDGYLEMAQQLGAIGFVNKADFADELPILLAILATLPARRTCQ
jgi:DNA-binding NarL/FixJ family response regulator